MKLDDAIKIVSFFKKGGLRSKLQDIEKLANTTSTTDFESLFSAAKIIKEASSQIDEVLHASGIMMALSVWLYKNEVIEYLSLGAGNHKERFDLETNLRIAEFKFGKWNESSANGVRRRGYFSNYVSLLTANETRKKYFVVEDKNAFIKFMNGTASWKNVLSKNPTGFKKLENFLIDNKIGHIVTVSGIYNHFEEVVTVVDFKEIIKTHE
jgi:hypothetical protein